jgi:hypothetical protein
MGQVADVWRLGDSARSRGSGCAALLVGLVLASQACVHSLPLGGAATGRGRPLGDQAFMLGMSAGPMPEVVGTLPELVDSIGGLRNPIPDGSRLRTSARFFDLLGFAYGVTDRLDLGLNFSRGLHAFLRVAGDESWALTVSPALFRYTGEAQSTYRGLGEPGQITNLNLTALGSLAGPTFFDRDSELYGGAGWNRYRAWIESDRLRVERTTTTATALAGLRISRTASVRSRQSSRFYDVTSTLGVELLGSFIPQRDKRTDFVTTLRVYLSVGGVNR